MNAARNALNIFVECLQFFILFINLAFCAFVLTTLHAVRRYKPKYADAPLFMSETVDISMFDCEV